MVEKILDFTAIGDRAKIALSDRVSDAVAAVGRAMTITSIGGARHPDANELGRHWCRRQKHSGVSTLSVGNGSRGKILPCSFVLVIHGVAIAHPVLHLEIASKWIGPLDADSIDGLVFIEHDDEPLRMERVLYASEIVAQVWISFPIWLGVSVIEAGVAIDLCASVASKVLVRQ